MSCRARLSEDASLAHELWGICGDLGRSPEGRAGLPVQPVANGGWDNWTFQLGAGMLVRLPSAAEYALAVDKEHRWLPALAPRLPLPIPAPLASRAGVALSTLRKIETGAITEPGYFTILAILSALGISLPEL